MNLYEILKDKSYSKFAILPLDNRQSYDEMIRKLNSADINTLRALYSKLVFLDSNSEGFALAKIKVLRVQGTMRYLQNKMQF